LSLPLSFQPPLIRTQSLSPVVGRYMQDAVGSSKKKRKQLKNRGGAGGVSPNAAAHLTHSVDEIHTEFYLTRVRGESEFDAAGIAPEIQPTLRFGRPDLPAMFKAMKDIALENGSSRVAVCVCGPPPLVSAARKLCDTSTNCQISFDFHTETFDF
jgi:Ferric reductase NAD binding domain